MNDFYIVFMWQPEYIFGKFFDTTFKAALASVGLADANKMTERAYNGHAKIFGQYCTEIEQALATYGFQPEVLTGQGYINLHYGLMNPVRSFEIEPPKYRADIPILDALENPDIVETQDNLAATATFAHVETEPNGWTIHDRGVPYYIRPVSVMGKPIRSAPCMLRSHGRHRVGKPNHNELEHPASGCCDKPFSYPRSDDRGQGVNARRRQRNS